MNFIGKPMSIEKRVKRTYNVFQCPRCAYFSVKVSVPFSETKQVGECYVSGQVEAITRDYPEEMDFHKVVPCDDFSLHIRPRGKK